MLSRCETTEEEALSAASMANSILSVEEEKDALRRELERAYARERETRVRLQETEKRSNELTSEINALLEQDARRHTVQIETDLLAHVARTPTKAAARSPRSNAFTTTSARKLEVREVSDDESDGEDHHAARLRKDADEDGGPDGGSDSEDDEDFAAGSESDGGEPTDESESESGSGDESDGSDAPAKKKAKKSKASPAGKKGGKKKTAKKDPNAPKRPLSSYMIFAGENRAKVVEENPGASIGDVGKALGAKWKEMSAEEKAPFEEKAKEAKAKYAEQMKAYEASKGGGEDDASGEESD